MQTANPDLGLFAIDHDSASYETGYDHGYLGREFRAPDLNNCFGLANYRAGYANGQSERAAARDFPLA